MSKGEAKSLADELFFTIFLSPRTGRWEAFDSALTRVRALEKEADTLRAENAALKE